MELTESIESINKQLTDLFGIATDNGKPLFRVVSSWDQLEKRLTNVTLEGFQLQQPEVLELPKYDQRDLDYKGKYILERLVVVPTYQSLELPTAAQSYEPLWVFRDKDFNPLPPTLWASKFVIDTMYAALGKRGMRKYVDEEAQHPVEMREQRIKKLQEELFGDESGLEGKTHLTRDAIVVPQSYEKE